MIQWHMTISKMDSIVKLSVDSTFRFLVYVSCKRRAGRLKLQRACAHVIVFFRSFDDHGIIGKSEANAKQQPSIRPRRMWWSTFVHAQCTRYGERPIPTEILMMENLSIVLLLSLTKGFTRFRKTSDLKEVVYLLSELSSLSFLYIL